MSGGGSLGGEPIQWFPGHMARAMRRLGQDVAVADAVVEVRDARVPHSGANPALSALAGRRPRLLVLTRADLADPAATGAWLERLAVVGERALAVDLKTTRDGNRLRAALEALAPGAGVLRTIVAGIPNAGKSSVINALAGKNVARVENRAGVTRSASWFRVGPRASVMDTAGILVPKIDSPDAQWKLALVGAVPAARYDAEAVVSAFAAWARVAGRAQVPDFETFAQSRGFLRRGTIHNEHNAALAYVKAFNEGKFGRMTLEAPVT